MKKIYYYILFLILILGSTLPPAQAQPFNPHIYSRNVEEYYIETKVFFLNQEAFDKMAILYFGTKDEKLVAFSVHYSDGSNEIFVVKKYGIYNEPSSEDIGHEIKHIINRLYKAKTGKHRFDPNCENWIEINPK